MRIVRTCLTLTWGLLAGLAATLAMAAEAPPTELPFELAVMETPVGTPLEDILSGKAQPGFTPVLTPGFQFAPRKGTATWVRIRTELPESGDQRWRLGLVRMPLDKLRLRLEPDGAVVAQDSFFSSVRGSAPWPGTFELAVPGHLAGKVALYLELEGEVSGGIHVRLRDVDTAAREQHAARRFFRVVYLLLLLVAALSVIRHVEEPRSGALAVGGAAFFTWLACLGLNGHLYSLPEIALLSGLGATVPQALFLLGAGPLVLATRHYSGLAKSSPGLVPWMYGLGWLLVVAALAGLLLPSIDANVMRLAAWSGYGVAIAACLLMLLLDSRSYRWAPLLTLLLLVAAMVARQLANRQLLPASLVNLYGWQAILAITVALYLFLPWIRARLQRWAMRKRAAPPEPSAEEKIAMARERLLSSLQSGLQNAADGDLKWIAFRRLLDGLKPVLPQTSAAVVAMHFHGENLLQVEPKDAEARYRELLGQRSTLLKNLSRLRAPQQVGIDFDGPDGPLDQVQLAIIPLPVEKPGWGALLVERQANITYSEAELALCAEFAAVAMLAGEEAANKIKDQRTADTDPDTGVYRREPLEQLLLGHVDKARTKQSPLSVLCVLVDQLPRLRESGGEDGAAAGLKPVAELLREESDYGDVLGRAGPDGFLLIAPGKRLLQAREYADKLRAAVARMAVDPRIAAALTVSIGVAQAGPDERNPRALVERASKVAQIAIKNGGNQIFS